MKRYLTPPGSRSTRSAAAADLRPFLRGSVPRKRLSIVVSVLALAAGPFTVRAQNHEPVLSDLRQTFTQPGLTLGLLLQAVVDPGLEGDPASVQVAAARLLAHGQLDGGFNYLLQTNFAGTPSLLDARVGWSPGSYFAVSAGRFKAPFSRELLTFAGAIDFVNRARVVEALAPNRQMGAQIGGDLSDHTAWTLGGFTGGRNSTPNEALAGVARLEGRDIPVGEGSLAVAAHAALGRDAAIGTGVFGSGFEGEGVLLGMDARFESGPLLLAGELIGGDWDPAGAADTDASGLYLTAGWTPREGHQALVRWDRYRAPTESTDDVLVLGYNIWPTEASEIQVNWAVPVRGSDTPHKVLVNFQVGF